MQVVPLNPIPAQQLSTLLNGQTCQIKVYQKFYGVFVDLYVSNSLIIGGVIAQDMNLIVRSLYLGFVGDLAFVDTQGDDDPDFTGLGSRFLLVYDTPADLAAAGIVEA